MTCSKSINEYKYRMEHPPAGSAIVLFFLCTIIRLILFYFFAACGSLLFTVEHAAHLAVVTSLGAGALYLLGSILLGWGSYLLAHRLGRRW